MDAGTASLLCRYVAAQEKAAGGHPMGVETYLFPGRIVGQPLSEPSLRYITRCEGVTAPQLFATAIAEFYRAGARIPKILVRALDITLPTAIHYSEAFAPRVNDELEQRAGLR